MNAKAAVERGGDAAWQRLDLWLWCARVAKARPDCARIVEDGRVRLNRQPTAKTHARLRIGDVLTIALRDEVRVWRVRALATRRGPASDARLLYEEVPEDGDAEAAPDPCAKPGPAAYRSADARPPDGDTSAEDHDAGGQAARDLSGDFPEDRHQER